MKDLQNIINMKRSLLEMHPKFEAVPGKNPALLEAANRPAVPAAPCPQYEKMAPQNFFLGRHAGSHLDMQIGMSQETHSEPIFGMDMGLFQSQLSSRQSVLSRRENEKEQIRHSAEWISKKEAHLCR
ncbi:MAG: hypothetical protein GY822_28110 [Deltaproteobacteria bacterium]|nr:hypothetical protein [Deltaproteobacteria bacterium]